MFPPSTIAHYRVTAKLGEGGMGAVYRATDTKLNRDVAIKVLTEAFAADSARMERFEREAQTLASLNHPNIAAIYGIEQGAIVMELVEGEELSGPVPVDTALEYARQIAAGLEAAHEKGIVHRDLKPANIKVTADGVVKLLDFGLAKAGPQVESGATLTMTQAGVIVGTAAYMSPEQARGKPVDKRTDIWAFGVILYELLTGSELFAGDTITDVLASVVKEAPDLNRVPPQVRKLLRTCLEKDPKQRLQAVGDWRLLIEETPAAPPVTAPMRNAYGAWLGWACTALALLCAVAAFGWWRALRPVDHPLLRFSADMGAEAVAATRITAAISPDGTRLVFPVRQGAGPVLLATRLMGQSKPTVLAGTEGAVDPFFSPDGQWIGFEAENRLKKVSIQGGAPVSLYETPGTVRGASWGEDGSIVFGMLGSGLLRVPAAGGNAQAISKPKTPDTSQRWPQILPGGEAILFTGHNAPTGFDSANIEVLLLKTGETRIVQRGGYFGRYLASGHLVFLHNGTLFGVPFDLGRYETRGLPAPVFEDVAGNNATAGGEMDFSRTGTVVYLSGQTATLTRSLIWLDASGKAETVLTLTASPISLRLSPDGRRLAFTSNGDLVVYDLQRGSTARLVSNGDINAYAVWTPDGAHLVYGPASGGIWWVRADGSGSPQPLYPVKTTAFPGSFSPDGRHLAFHHAAGAVTHHVWVLPVDPADPDHPKAGLPQLFVASEGADIDPAFSPDGQWLAYASRVSGTFQVFVRPFPEGASGGGQAQISTVSGKLPMWSRASREIFYLAEDGHIMAVPYTVKGRTLEPGKARVWSETTVHTIQTYPAADLSPDGKRILAFAEPTAPHSEGNLHLTFVLNFFDELKRRMPPK
ncbi:MAG TPA: protein kinase [Verrucomicrobiae bacterium]|nr:protein kinase [Verrucomicrobiae bacterium]